MSQSRELKCYDGRKSFYGKAHIIEKDEGRIVLRSYQTDVCQIDHGKFERLWGGYSATTMRHINSFLIELGIPGGGKAWWDKQRVVSEDEIASRYSKRRRVELEAFLTTEN